MRAAVVHAPRQLTIEDVPDPVPRPGDVIIAVHANGLCGSDLHLYDGEWSTVSYPVIPGHEFAGEVVAVGRDVGDGLIGRRFAVDPTLGCGACDHCLAGRRNVCRRVGGYGVTRPGGSATLAAVAAVNLVPIPDDLPYVAAAVSQPLACAVHALRRADIQRGERVLVVGAGAAGLLLAQAARTFGASSVVVCEPVAARRRVAEQLDLSGVFPDVDAAVEAHPQRFSLVTDATGRAEILAASFEATDTGGTLIAFGICGQGATVAIEPVKLYEREVRIVGTRGLNGTQRAAVELLASGQLRWEPLVDDRNTLDHLPHALRRLRRSEIMKAVTVSGGA